MVFKHTDTRCIENENTIIFIRIIILCYLLMTFKFRRKRFYRFIFVTVDLTGKIYQTNAALKEENLMFCYECNTMINGKSCSNFTDKEDFTKFSTKCTGDNKTCMVN